MKLSIIILSYNTKDLTIRCVESVIRQYKEEIGNGEVEIVVVDNASSDESVAFIKNQKSKIKNQNYRSKFKIVQNEENLGFSGGCKIGARESEGKYILFLNSDTEVLDGGFLRMVKFLDENEHVGILGGKLLNKDGSPQPSCGKFYNLFNLFLMLIGMERFGILRTNPNKLQKVDWVSGGCMMVRKFFFERLKGFDEHFFMYIEDMELCFRAKQLGLLTYFYPDIKVLHKEFGSSNRSFAIINIYKGILYFYSKHKSHLQFIIAKFLLKTKAVFGIFVGIVIGNSSLYKTYKRAIEIEL